MRKSTEVHLTLLASLALSMTACHQRRDCVDASNRLLPASACQAGTPIAGGGAAHWVYGGSSGGHVGDTVVGGSVSRGGFGGHGGADAGGS